MVKRVWKELKPEDLATVQGYLDGLPQEQRPLYGLTGIKTSLWSRLGGGAMPYVVLFTRDRIVLSKRSVGGQKERERREYTIGDLTGVTPRHGPLLDSALFRFADGFTVRVGNIPHTQIEPVVRFLHEGLDAFDPGRLTSVQRTNCYYTFISMQILSRDLL